MHAQSAAEPVACNDRVEDIMPPAGDTLTRGRRNAAGQRIAVGAKPD